MVENINKQLNKDKQSLIRTKNKVNIYINIYKHMFN